MRLIDTSAWIEALRPEGDADTRRAVDEAAREGDAALCDVVLLELWIGARGTAEQATIAQLAANLPMLPIDADVWEKAHGFARACRASGVTVPTTDLVIAACADHHRVDILERDAHFGQIARAIRTSRKGTK
jgi:predicted nucleic acid-binding protein